VIKDEVRAGSRCPKADIDRRLGLSAICNRAAWLEMKEAASVGGLRFYFGIVDYFRYEGLLPTGGSFGGGSPFGGGAARILFIMAALASCFFFCISLRVVLFVLSSALADKPKNNDGITSKHRNFAVSFMSSSICCLKCRPLILAGIDCCDRTKVLVPHLLKAVSRDDRQAINSDNYVQRHMEQRVKEIRDLLALHNDKE